MTGGAGFIGSHLVERLLADGWYVDVLDDLSTGRLSNLPQSDRLRTHMGSAGYAPLVTPLVRAADLVCHLAAVVGVQRVLEIPLQTLEGNLQATTTMLTACSKRGVRTIITSSSEVYGRSMASMLSETDDLQIGPQSRWGYAASKLVDEFLAQSHFHTHGLPVTTVRLFNVIGPKQRSHYGSVVPRMIGQAIADTPITVIGDGTQRRAFTWVGDTVAALIDLSRSQHAHGEVVNIGAPKSTAIIDVAQTIKRLTQSRSEIVHITQMNAYGCEFEDIQARLPDLTKLRQLIDFHPILDFDEMIERILIKEKCAVA